MSLWKSKSVFAASERQYTAAGGEVQVPRGGFTNDSRLNEEIDSRIGKAKRSCVWTFPVCGDKTGAFKEP